MTHQPVFMLPMSPRPIDVLGGHLRRGSGELALRHELARSRRAGVPLVIAMMDVDSLKAVNDADGHLAGDALLRDVPRAMTGKLRAYDVIVRWGGDEFVCALSDVDLNTATQRIAETLIDRADSALYRVKSNRIR